LFQNLAGAVDLRDGNLDYLIEPGLWPSSLVPLVAVIWLWRRGNPLPGLLLLSTVLVFPLFNAFFEPILNGRYLEPIVPILFAAIAAFVVTGFDQLQTAGVASASSGRRLRWAGQVGLGLAVLFL